MQMGHCYLLDTIYRRLHIDVHAALLRVVARSGFKSG
jgi:hypothetical protein